MNTRLWIKFSVFFCVRFSIVIFIKAFQASCLSTCNSQCLIYYICKEFNNLLSEVSLCFKSITEALPRTGSVSRRDEDNQAKIERGMVLTNVTRRLGHKAYPYMNKKNCKGADWSAVFKMADNLWNVLWNIIIVREHCRHVTFAKEVGQKGNRRTLFMSE